jgi:hypothetical protein
MDGYLIIGAWNGRQRIPVNVIGETPEGFKVRAQERVFLPGRGVLKRGDSATVPKDVVEVQRGAQSR